MSNVLFDESLFKVTVIGVTITLHRSFMSSTWRTIQIWHINVVVLDNTMHIMYYIWRHLNGYICNVILT